MPTTIQTPTGSAATAPLAAPTGVAAGVASAAGITVSWAAVAGALSYAVWRSSAYSGAGATLLASGLTGLTYADTTAPNQAAAYYFVTATHAAGTSAYSGVATGWRYPTTPAAPAGLAASEDTPGLVTLTWEAAADADYYEVWRNTTDDSATAVQIGGTFDLTWTDAIAFGLTRYYWVKAVNFAGVSAFSAGDSGYSPYPVPEAPTDVQADGYADYIAVTALPATYATSYSVWRNTTNNSATAVQIASGLSTPEYDDDDAALALGTTYYYWLKATNASGTSGFSASDSGAIFGDPLDAPTGVAATDGDPGAVTITWSAVAGATSYAVYRSDTAGGTKTLLASGLTGLSYDDESLTTDAVRYYYLKATDGTLVSAYSGYDSGYATAPAAPTSVAATSTLEGHIEITATGSAGATSYSVWRSDSFNSTSYAVQIAYGLSTPEYDDTDDGLEVGANYYYWMKAHNAIGASEFSASDHGAIALPAPTGVAATDGHISSVTITWSAVSGATSYRVYRATTNDPGAASVIASGLTGLTYNDTSGTTGTTYYYWVDATDGYHVSGLSASDSGYSSAPTAPAAPTGVAATDGDSDLVTITWSAAAGAASYSVWRAATDDSGAASLLASGLEGVTYDDTSGTPGTTYYYFVKATNAYGTSGFSLSNAGYAATPTLAAPAGVSATDGEPGVVTLTWSAVTGATSYAVYRSNTAGGTKTLLASGLTGLSYDDESLATDAVRYFFVKATDGTLVSDFSDYDSGYAVAPAAPTGVAATSTLEGHIEITATGSAGATSYSVWRSDSVNLTGYAVQIASGLSTPEYDDDDAALEVGVNYYYWLKAHNAIGASEFSASDPGAIALPAPTGVAATDGHISSVTITWSAVTGATSYAVYRATTNDPGAASLIASGLTGLTYNDTSGTTGTTYYYWVDATDGYHVSAVSASDSGYSSAPTAPAAPTGVAATDGEPGLVTITWSAAAGAASYSVWRATTNSSGSATLLATGIEALSYDDTAGTVGTTYYYFVKATNAYGTSDFSASDSGYATTSTTYTDPPAWVSATDGTGGDLITVTWAPVTDATVYKVYRGTTSSSGAAALIATLGDVDTYDDESLTDTGTYYYWVTATAPGDLESVLAPVSSAEYGSASVPGTPGSVVATTTDSAKVRLTWTAPSYARTYEVFRATSNSFGAASSIATGLTALLYDDTPTVNTDFWYWVKAHNDVGTSSASSSGQGYRPLTAPAAPTGVDATDGSVGQTTVTWSAADYADSYSVFREPYAGGSNVEIASGLTALTYDDTSGTSGVVYVYTVKATNAVGTSAASTGNTGYRYVSIAGLSISGGEEGHDVTYWSNAGPAYTFAFDAAASISDRLRIYLYWGQLHDTGCITGTASPYLYIGSSNTVRVQITPHCAGPSGTTAWSLTVS